jgi:hypothetical protein
MRIDSDLPHAREINHYSALAGTEPGKAMPAATYRGQQSCGTSGANCALNVTGIGATRNQSRPAIIEHTVPYAA